MRNQSRETGLLTRVLPSRGEIFLLRPFLSFLCLLLFNLYPKTGLAGGLTGREEDPVIIRGEDLPRLLQTPVDRIVLYRRKEGVGGNLEPIPSQIDEFFFDEKSNRSIPILEGDPASPSPDGLLSENDEVVFMARDAGERLPHLPPPNPSKPFYEVEISDPSDQAKGWIYLADKPPSTAPHKTSKPTYVQYDPASDTTRTEYFKVHFSREKAALPEKVYLPFPEGGGKYQVLEKAEVRIDVKTIFFSIFTSRKRISNRISSLLRAAPSGSSAESTIS